MNIGRRANIAGEVANFGSIHAEASRYGEGRIHDKKALPLRMRGLAFFVVDDALGYSTSPLELSLHTNGRMVLLPDNNALLMAILAANKVFSFCLAFARPRPNKQLPNLQERSPKFRQNPS